MLNHIGRCLWVTTISVLCAKFSVDSVILAMEALLEGRGPVRVATYLCVTMVLSYICALGIASVLRKESNDEKS
jgi:hypothetical protein